MAKIKLDKILEACDTLVLKTNVAILEEAALSGLSDTEVAKSKLIIHENIRYIKNQLTQGGILESAQNMLADNWVEAIMEDMSLSDMVDQGRQYAPGMEDDGMSAGQMAGAGLAGAGLAAAGAGVRYGIPAARGYVDGGVAGAAQAARGQMQNDVNAVKAGANHAALAGANMAADASQAGRRMAFDAGRQVSSAADQASQAVKQGVANQVGAATAGYNGIQGPNKPGAGAAYKVGSMAGKVRRVFK